MAARIRMNLHILGVDATRPKTWGWATWLAVLSVSMNIFWFVWTVVQRPPPTVFDNWKQL